MIITGVFRYDNTYAAPTKEQRERYMKGDSEEHLFGPDNQIMLIVYDEIKRLIDEHANKKDGSRSFVSGRKIE